MDFGAKTRITPPSNNALSGQGGQDAISGSLLDVQALCDEFVRTEVPLLERSDERRHHSLGVAKIITLKQGCWNPEAVHG